MTAGRRFRATVDPATFGQAPGAAVDPSGDRLVHWSAPAGGTDPFMDGVRWGLVTSLTAAFGDTIGRLLALATLENVQYWDTTSSSWELVA